MKDLEQKASQAEGSLDADKIISFRFLNSHNDLTPSCCNIKLADNTYHTHCTCTCIHNCSIKHVKLNTSNAAKCTKDICQHGGEFMLHWKMQNIDYIKFIQKDSF